MKGKKKWKRRVVALALAFLMLTGTFLGSNRSIQAKPEEEKQMERFDAYDAKRISQEAQEIGVGFANTHNKQTYSNYSNARWFGGDERYAGKIVNASASGIQIDIVTYNPVVIHKSWKEGVLGFKDPDDPNNTSKHERAFCVDPSMKFKAGTLVCQPMEEIYNYETMQLVCAMLQYIDNQSIYHQHLSTNDIYALRQCAVWVVLNTVEGWYSRDVYFEFGNGVPCPGDSSCYISTHVSDLMNNGWAWAHNNYKRMKPKNCYYWYNKAYPSTGQPLSTWDYDYDNTNWLAIQKKPSSNGGWIDGVWYNAEEYAKWCINNNSAYSLEGAKYTAWNEETGQYYYDCITTDKYGYGWCYLPMGKYQIQESVPPKGYMRDETWYKVDISTTNYTFTHPEPIKTAGIKIHKSAVEATTQSLAGAKYGIYWYEGDIVQNLPQYIITTDESGYGEIKNIPLWNYYIKEIEAPKGFGLDQNVYQADCTTPGSYSEIVVDINSKEPLAFGKITLQKQSANPDCTNNNTAYSLKGAEYSIYSNPECTNYIDKMITDENGYAEKDELKLGTYYVKESKAPEGYHLDKSVYKVKLPTSSGELKYQITSKENPLLETIKILIKKVDKDTGKPIPVGPGSLKGAEFVFRFYKGEYPKDTNPDMLGKKVDKTWIFATDEKGEIRFNEKFLVKGDSFYLDEKKVPVLPVGTLVIIEKKAPEGYHINPITIVKNIKPEGTKDSEVYVTPEIKEDSVSVKIIKVQDGNNIHIPDAVFRHTMPDGTTKDYTTDEKGEIQLQGLIVGKHQVVEISPAEGYLPNTSVFEFEVTVDHQVRAITQPTEDMGIFFAEEKNGDGTLTVKNKLAPFNLKIHKVNNKDTVLEGAEFTLYEDKYCNVEVDKQVSGKDGNLAFKDVQTSKEYYLKETKAPTGYKLPVNPDGNPVIYKIKVESDPIKDSFIVYVNDKAYDTNSNGFISISGTKKDKEVNVTVVNTVNGRLPNTGSHSMIWILAVGSILMIATLKKKKEIIK